jgi:hypothetical protein
MELNEISRPVSRLEELQYTDEPNKAMRKMLAQRWKKMPEERQISIRAARSKRGIKCKICGKIGYFMENCPNECVSPPGTPDSWASTPPGTPPKSPVGLGVLWGDRSEKPPSPLRYDYKKKVDTGVTRPPALAEEERLREQDAKIGTFAFFAEAEEGHADSYAQMSLHQVMRRLMRLLERQLHKNTQELEATFDTSLLHPPFQKERNTFYPPELSEIKEYRDYFYEKEKKKENRKVYQNQSSVRSADELDPLFRGGNLNDDFLYKVNPRAGASMHSKNTWKSILSHSDDLASSDPTMAKKEQKLQELFRSQSKWIAMQQRGMAQKNDRFEHLVHILKEEIKREHEREYRNLEASKHGEKATQMKVYQERLESVDKIMTCLHSYNFTSGLDEADFLFFCFDKWKQTLENKLYGKNRSRPKKYKRVDAKTAAKDGTSGFTNGSSKSAALSRSATGLTEASAASLGGTTKDSQSTTAVANMSGPGLDYNRMISAASPYAKDLAFLEYMKKKHEAARLRAMAPVMTAAGGSDDNTVSTGSTMKAPILWDTKPSAHSAADTSTQLQRARLPFPRQVSFASEISMESSVLDSDFIYSDNSASKDSSLVPSQQQLAVVVPKGDNAGTVAMRASLSAESSIYDASALQLVNSHTRKPKGRDLANFTVKRRLHPRVMDEINMEKAKTSFR